jgi:class 3 adenylate cyclase
MGSVETVTVLLTDLVGSTELASRIGPERAEELRVEHFRLLREAIAASSGREMKNLGDRLMVVFITAAAAIECAASMQQRIEFRNRVPFGVRVGVAMGDASGEGDYFGPPVIEAARLCAKADGGQVLLTAVTRVMAGRRGDYGFSPIGQLDLKGLPEPVAACELVWEPLPEMPSALPRASGHAPEPLRDPVDFGSESPVSESLGEFECPARAQLCFDGVDRSGSNPSASGA